MDKFQECGQNSIEWVFKNTILYLTIATYENLFDSLFHFDTMLIKKNMREKSLDFVLIKKIKSVCCYLNK